MAWQVSSAELAEGVAARRRQLADGRAWDSFERLARGLRWIDELEESRRYFHAAAVDLIARIERRGRGDGTTRAQTAGFFALAGEERDAREWGVRAGRR